MVPSFLAMAALLFEYGIQHTETRLLMYAMACPLVGVVVGTLIVAVSQNEENLKKAEGLKAATQQEHKTKSEIGSETKVDAWQPENKPETNLEQQPSPVLDSAPGPISHPASATPAPELSPAASAPEPLQNTQPVAIKASEALQASQPEKSNETEELDFSFLDIDVESQESQAPGSSGELISMVPDGPEIPMAVPVIVEASPSTESAENRLAVPIGLPVTNERPKQSRSLKPAQSEPILNNQKQEAPVENKQARPVENQAPASKQEASKASAQKPQASPASQNPAIKYGANGEPVLPNFDRPEQWLAFADQMYDSENFDVAILCYDKVTNLDANNFDAWYLKGIAFRRKGQNNDALYCLNYCLNLKGNSPVALTEKANCLLELGKVQQALACFDKSLTLDRIEARPWLGKGKCLALLGKHKEAVACFDKALVLQPNNEEAKSAKAESTNQI